MALHALRQPIIVLLLLLASPCLSLAKNPDTIRLATHNLCPYGCYDMTDRFDGHAIRVIRYALDKMEISLNIVVVPWERAQYLTWKGEVDGFFAASQNAKRDEKGVMSAIVAEQTWTWYLLKDNPLDPNSADFKRLASVGSFHGANMLKWLKENDYNVVATPPDTNFLTDMLMAGRMDALLANNQVMGEIIRAHRLEGIFKSVTCKHKPLGVYFSMEFIEKHPGFIEDFNYFVEEYRNRETRP